VGLKLGAGEGIRIPRPLSVFFMSSKKINNSIAHLKKRLKVK